MCAAAHTRVHFFCLPKRSEPKKKAPDDLPHAGASGALRFSVKTGAAELTMLRMVQTVLASPGFVLMMLGGVNGTGVPLTNYGVSRPLGGAELSQPFPAASACMSDRAHQNFGPGVSANKKIAVSGRRV